MPPKKTETKAEGAAAPKAKAAPTHGTYQAMITDAIVARKDRYGSSRQALKKYVKANNNITVSDNMFDSLFNKALKAGVEKGVFEQPKGPSGGTKLAKKSAAPAAVKKPAAKKAAPKKEAKETKEKKEKKAPAPKKAAPKKEAKETKEKKVAAPKKPAAKKETKKPAEKALTKTKTGRVTKTAKPAATKKAAPKKAAAPKKEKTPKKAEASA
ncbi:hypothetical protein GQ53DRAFT_826316 [Thozetella sp. PMI_491]|nr:hypothetical protein GQ53DRAFT_826316 [Thozetella sp. PMI_491]